MSFIFLLSFRSPPLDNSLRTGFICFPCFSNLGRYLFWYLRDYPPQPASLLWWQLNENPLNPLLTTADDILPCFNLDTRSNLTCNKFILEIKCSAVPPTPSNLFLFFKRSFTHIFSTQPHLPSKTSWGQLTAQLPYILFEKWLRSTFVTLFPFLGRLIELILPSF